MLLQNDQKENIKTILQRIFSNRGFEILDYNLAYIQRRIHGRISTLGIEALQDYENYLKSNPYEYNSLFNAILGSESQFFRDYEAWDFLNRAIIPKIIYNQNMHAKKEIRVWSIGCASGEEDYSLAISLIENLKTDIGKYEIKIFATDIDESALRIASSGTYMPEQLIGLPDYIKNKYFTNCNNLYTISDEVKHLLIFEKHNLVTEPAISNIDLLLCRNVMIYLEPSLRPKVIQNLRYALNENGYLWLGKGEKHIDSRAYGFKPLETKWRIFKKISNKEYYQLPLIYDKSGNKNTYQENLDNNIWYKRQNRKTSAIVLNENYEVILYNQNAYNLCFNEHADQTNPDDHKLNDNRWINNSLIKPETQMSFFDLNISYHFANIKEKVKQAIDNSEFLTIDGVEHWINKNKRIYLKIEIIPLAVINNSNKELLISFEDITNIYELHKKFQYTVKSFEIANEKLLSANSILKNATDELEAINEYLRSKNNEDKILINKKFAEQNMEIESLKYQYEAILNIVDFGILIIDQNLVIKNANQVAANILEANHNDIKGKSLKSLNKNEALTNITQKVIEFMKMGSSLDYMVELLDADYGKRVIDVSINPIGKDKSEIFVLVIKERRNHHANV